MTQDRVEEQEGEGVGCTCECREGRRELAGDPGLLGAEGPGHGGPWLLLVSVQSPPRDRNRSHRKAREERDTSWFRDGDRLVGARTFFPGRGGAGGAESH